MTLKTGQAATSAELPAGTEAPREIMLLPAGDLPTRAHDSREPWHNPDAAAVVQATRDLGLEMPIDYEHQGERSERNGQPAPAAGWIKRVFERAGAVWAEVEWTEKARQMIEAKEYRFISPFFQYDRQTRVVKRIIDAALTNNPAFHMTAIARVQDSTEEDEVDKSKLIELFGLKADATDEEIFAACKAAVDAKAAASVATAGLKDVATALGLDGEATAEDVTNAAKAAAAAKAGGTPDPEKFVPRTEFDAVSERLKTLETKGATDAATAAVDQAVKDGKVTPANRDWALEYATANPEGFKKFVEGAPKILSDGRAVPASKPGEEDGTAALSAQDKEILERTGISAQELADQDKPLDEAIAAAARQKKED